VSIVVESNGLNIDGRRIPLLSGDVHYWRHPANLWPTLLQKVHDLGLRIISIYIPWSVHETSPGNFDFGELDPAKNLGAFLDLAHETGLAVLTRPGPHINAEITLFGYPERLFEDPTYLARNPQGGVLTMPIPPRAFPMISYASEAFWREVEIWFDALTPILRPRLHPHGPIFAMQVDNECSYFFRTAPYDCDYHPDARNKWLDFLKAKYGQADAVNDVYDNNSPLSDLPMPERFRVRAPKDLPYHLDWIEFKEELLADSLTRLRTLWEDRGVRDVPFFHNFPPSTAQSPLSITRVEQNIDFCGLDSYLQKDKFDILKRRFLFLTGQSRFPVAPEQASGCYHAWPPIDLHDQHFTALASYMFGVKGMNYYMIVERERWYGSPITRQGGIRKESWNFMKDHLDLLYRLRPWELERKVSVLLLSVRDYERLENASNALSPVTPMVTEQIWPNEELCLEGNFGFSRPIQLLHAKMLRGWERGLTRLGIPYAIGSTDLTLERLSRHKVIVCPTFEFLSRDAQQRLRLYVEAGGNLICGPEVPSYDERQQEFSTLDGFASRPNHRLECSIDTLVCNAGAGRLILVTEVPMPIEQAEPVVRAAAKHLHLESIYPAIPPCETSLHLGPDGRKVLFVANPTAQALRPDIITPIGRCFTDLETGDKFYGHEAVPVEMPPYTVRVLEVEPC